MYMFFDTFLTNVLQLKFFANYLLSFFMITIKINYFHFMYERFFLLWKLKSLL